MEHDRRQSTTVYRAKARVELSRHGKRSSGLHKTEDQWFVSSERSFNSARCTAFVPLGSGCTGTIPWPAGSSPSRAREGGYTHRPRTEEVQASGQNRQTPREEGLWSHGGELQHVSTSVENIIVSRNKEGSYQKTYGRMR